jgi:hypothetical protein
MKLAVKQNSQDKTFSLDVLRSSERFKSLIDESRVVMIHDIHHDTSLDYSTYIVITKDKPISKGEPLYTVTRFFTIGYFENQTIHAAVNYTGKTAAEVFALLMDKQYSRGTY